MKIIQDPVYLFYYFQKLSSKLSKSKKKIKDLKVRQPDIVKNLGSFDSQIVDDRIR